LIRTNKGTFYGLSIIRLRSRAPCETIKVPVKTAAKIRVEIPPDREPDLPELTLRKHVAAVHCTGLGLLQRKVFNVLLVNAYDELLTKTQHRIELAVLRVLIDYNSRDRAPLKEALRAIRAVPVEFNLLGDGDPEDPPWTVTGLISEASIEDGMVVYSFGPKMAEALYNPSIYALINLRVQSRLTSSFALNLYENLARFRNVGSTGWIPLETVRKMLDAVAPLYDEFKRLNTRVLQKAMDECNRKSDLSVAMEVRRQATKGRPVTHLKFKIRQNDQQPLFPFPIDHLEAVRATPTFKELRRIGVGERLALKAVAETPDYAATIATLVENERKKGKIKQPAAYAAKMLREMPALSPQQREIAGGVAPAAPPLATPSITSETDAASKIRRVFEAARRKRALADLTADQRRELLRTWWEDARESKSFLLRGCDLEAGKLTGLAESDFERFVTRTRLGEPTENELQQWIARQLAAS